jgi:mannose-6-phosphate isomerase-like protein (cupin superfamily)
MEVFIVDDGQAIFILGDERMTIGGGNVVIVPIGVPHKFVSTGTSELRLVAIHCSPETISEYME